MIQNLFYLCLQQPGFLAVCFGGELDSIFFLSGNGKAAHDEQIFLEITVYLAHDIEGLV